jgi:anaerobic ribonucleoside-triphosphate reductase activating protein
MRLNLNQVVFGLGRGVLGATANRMGVWTQGCSLSKCPGCSSTHTWAPDDGRPVAVATLLQLALAQVNPPSGLTISGGEPTDQADAVAELAKVFREAFPTAEVILYSGLRWPTLAREYQPLLALLDVVVSGPYVRTLDATTLSGSRNQEVRLLTPLAAVLYRDYETWPLHAMQVGHLSRGSEDRVVTVGIPDIRRMQRAARQIGCQAMTWKEGTEQARRTDHE